MTSLPPSENPTIFGKIIRKEVPAKIVYEDELIIAFHSIAPEAKVHVVVTPKLFHLQSLQHATPEHAAVLGHLITKMPEIAAVLGIKDSGFRVISNNGTHSGQEVPHVHFHLLGGEPLGANILPKK